MQNPKQVRFTGRSIVKDLAKLYKNCIVKIKVGKSYADVDYTTGVHQGDNMSPVLFLFVIQAFLDTLKLESCPTKFSYFRENKNGNTRTTKGRLLNQNSAAKGTVFELQSSFYVDDSCFIFQDRDELKNAINVLDTHFSRFGLKMHVGSNTAKAKSEAMFFLSSLKEAKMQSELPEDITLPNGGRIHFTDNFKYLGSYITPLLSEDFEIESRIKKSEIHYGLRQTFLR
jgi:hypothetical protein